ncbi:MAG: transcription termination/antitermination factor NusG [Oscillospiraceae bacterium]|nr:transcription termination/antitermination factor NusG [Oscillospiraceae bacterium]
MAEDAKWYVAHTYSGYENKVKESIEKTVENRGLQNLIMDVKVPVEDVVEKRGDTEKIVQRKIFPGYVVIKMIMTDESWYVVRNTRGVTGFVGPGSKPVPLSDSEVRMMGVDEVRRAEIKLSVGDLVEIQAGPMEGFSGNIEKIDQETGTLWVTVSMFGRETSVEINYTQVALVD